MPRDPRKTGIPMPPQANPAPLKPPVASHVGGRPPGAATTTASVPGTLPGGTPRQTALVAPVPAPTRQGIQPRDRRQAAEEVKLIPGQVQAAPAPLMPPTAEAQAKPALVPGTEKGATGEEKLGALSRGQVPGASAEGEPGTGKPLFRMDRNIVDFKELDTAPMGVFQTPQGTLEKLPTGKIKVKDLSPEAKVRIQAIETEEIKKFGNHPGMDDPNSPRPPVRAGKPWFNPFTGQWGNGGRRQEEVSVLEEFG